jgi:transcriptional regulator with XRE-family HTH domain
MFVEGVAGAPLSRERPCCNCTLDWSLSNSQSLMNSKLANKALISLTLGCPLYKLTHMEGIGPFIRRRRDELDLSLRELAKRLDCSPAFISDIELGRRHPSDKVLLEMARILKVKIEELRETDVRAPIDEIKRITQDDPTFALAFRTVIDKNISANDLLEFVRKKEGEKKGKDKK